MRGLTVGEPVSRHEFHRTDTIVVRAAPTGSASASAKLLDRKGQALTDLPVAPGKDAEWRLPLGSLGPGDYVIEVTARTADTQAQQFLAFRVVR